MGRIAGMLSRVPNEPTPLQRELDRVGRLLGLVVIGIAVTMIATRRSGRMAIAGSSREIRPRELCLSPRGKPGSSVSDCSSALRASAKCRSRPSES
jgi:hypothetical protein